MPVAVPMTASVTSTAVISTTNITGFLISKRGSSLRNACGMAARRSSGSKTPRGLGGSPDGLAPPRVTKRWKRLVPRPSSTDEGTKVSHGQKTFPAFWSSCSTIGPRDERREERQCSDDDHDADQEDGQQDAGRRERAQGRRDPAFGGHRARQGEDRDDHPEPPDQHREPAGDVVERRVASRGPRRPTRCCRSGWRTRTGSRRSRGPVVQRPRRALAPSPTRVP